MVINVKLYKPLLGCPSSDLKNVVGFVVAFAARIRSRFVVVVFNPHLGGEKTLRFIWEVPSGVFLSFG